MWFAPSFRFLKQTKFPPKRIIPIEKNPLTWWSKKLPTQWRLSSESLTLREVSVGLEGCESAFNATNSIRTCWYFQTEVPPTFLRLQKWGDIEHLQHQNMNEDKMRTVGEAMEDKTGNKLSCTPDPSTVNDSCLSQKKQSEEVSGTEDEVADETTGKSCEKDIGGQCISGSNMALFGSDTFFSAVKKENKKLVVLENFLPSSRSVFRFRFPPNSALVMGHENKGVNKELFHVTGKYEKTEKEKTGYANYHSSTADEPPLPFSSAEVVFIPQYGTISSLNVVTALGIGLFYAFLDTHYPHSRKIISDDEVLSDEQKTRYASLLQYQKFYREALPTSNSSSSTPDKYVDDCRVDARPIHPIFYKKDEEEISQFLCEHRQLLLELCAEDQRHLKRNDAPCRRFNLSVLYENEFDQRNFGGLIRNANAFCVDQLLYVGRRKYNVVGSVGCYHYTRPHYLGLGFDASEAERSVKKASSGKESEDSDVKKESTAIENAVEKVLSDYKEADTQRERIIRLASWSLQCREKVNKVCGGPCQWWLLDCGHHPLYAEVFTNLQHELKKKKEEGDSLTNSLSVSSPHSSSIESLRWYLAHCSDSNFFLNLTDTEEKIREAAENGVLLLVPQEGKLPHISLLMQCERILSVVPPIFEGEAAKTMAGLPSQVASGIALQRLSAILHPKLCQL